jgi:hypothetical protein
VLTFESDRFKDQVVRTDFGEIYQTVAPPVIPEHVWQSGFADFALELPPVNAREVDTLLAIFFCFQPAFDTVVVNELNSASAFANLEQRVFIIEDVVPA